MSSLLIGKIYRGWNRGENSWDKNGMNENLRVLGDHLPLNIKYIGPPKPTTANEGECWIDPNTGEYSVWSTGPNLQSASWHNYPPSEGVIGFSKSDEKFYGNTGESWVFQTFADPIQDATEFIAGKVELATVLEAIAGTDTKRAVTPAGLVAAIQALAGGGGNGGGGGGGTVVVATPSITFPTDGATSVSLSLTATSSAFSLISGAATHQSSDWQIAADTSFTNVVASTSSDVTNKTSWSPSGLSASTVYYIRVRHTAAGGVTSQWSASVSFATAAISGSDWSVQSSGTSKVLTGVAANGSTFVAVGDVGTVITSPTGTTWTTRSSGTNELLWGVANNGSLFVAVGSNGKIITSPDGVTWTSRVSNTANSLRGCAYGSNKFVAVGDQGSVVVSLDGSTWSVASSGTTQGLNGVSYGGNIFVAVGDQGFAMTSTDGVSWTPRTTPVFELLYGINYKNGLFTAVGSSGCVITSTDGITWAQRSSGVSVTLFSISNNGSQFAAVGDNGSITTSADGITWVTRISGTTNRLRAVASKSGIFVAVGANGTVVKS